MKSKSLLIISNAVLVLLIGILVGVFYNFNSTPHIITFVLLLLTLSIPSIYMMIASRTNLNPELSNLLAPSLIWTACFFLANLIATIIMLCVKTLSWKALLITELVIVCIYVIVLLILCFGTNYIKKVYKGE